MQSVSHLSKIPSQIYQETFEEQLNLVGKSVTFINTLINTDDVINVPEFTITDSGTSTTLFPQGNYTFEEFIDQLVKVMSTIPARNVNGDAVAGTSSCFFSNESGEKRVYFNTYLPYERNITLYKYLPYRDNDTEYWYPGTYIPLEGEEYDNYLSNYITWSKIYMLRVYCNFIDNDNDLISIPIYAEKGLDNSFALSDLSIPCIDGIYNDIQWEVYDQLNNPVPLNNTNLYIYFTAS